MKSTILYFLRTDLNIRHRSQGSEFETCWIHLTRNITLGVVYQQTKEKDKHFLKHVK